MTTPHDWDSGSSTPSSPEPTTYEHHDLGTDEPTPPKERAQQAASTAQQEGAHVAETAMSEAQQVAGEAKEKAADLLADAKSQIGEQSKTQLQALVSKLDELRDEIDGMIEGSAVQGTVTDLARQLSDKTKSLSSHLHDREPGDLLDDVRSFARRRPGTFLIGAVATGVVAGRLTRGAKQAHDDDASSSTSSTPAQAVPTHTPTFQTTTEPAVGGAYHDDLGARLTTDVPPGQNTGGTQ